MFKNLSWQDIAAFLGVIAIFSTAFAGILRERKKSWEDRMSKMEQRATELETQFALIIQGQANLARAFEEHSKQDMKALEILNNKLDHNADMIVQSQNELSRTIQNTLNIFLRKGNT